MKKLQKHYHKLDRLPVVKYIYRMFSKKIITPKQYQETRSEYDDAEKRRREEVKRLYTVEKWSLKEIADYFTTEDYKMSESYVSRIVRGER